MDIIGITGSYERSSVAEILSYDLRIDRASLDDRISESFVRELQDLKKNSEKDYYIVEGPSIFYNEKLFDLIDHKFYIADETTKQDSQKTMPGVIVLESPGKTNFYYRSQILTSLNLKLE